MTNEMPELQMDSWTLIRS